MNHHIPSVAVIPFKNLIRETEMDHFLEGMVEDINTDLSRFNDIRVMSSHSTGRLSMDKDENLIDNLNCDFLISGTFQQRIKKIRFTLQIIRTKDKVIIFAGRHEETLEGLYEKYDSILQQIVHVLQKEININLLSSALGQQSASLATYELWLKGMAELKKGGRSHDLEARKIFKKALTQDEAYSRAYTGIAFTYFNEWSCQFWQDWDKNHEMAQTYAGRALEKNPNDYQALMIMGKTSLFKREFEISEQYLRRAISINPNDADLLAHSANSFAFLGLIEEAWELYEKAIYLNPLHKESYFTYGVFILFEKKAFQECIDLALRTIEDSGWVDFHVFVAAAYHYLGEEEKVIPYYQQYLARYEEKIVFGNPYHPKDAIQWLIDMNPYRNRTHFHDFIEHLSKIVLDQKNIIVPDSSLSTQKGKGKWQSHKNYYLISYHQQEFKIPAMKGLDDLSRLIQKPNTPFHCAELMEVIVIESGIELIDEKARTKYRQKLRELLDDLEEAKRVQNQIESERIRREYDQLMEYLSSILGKDGKARESGSTIERARTAVTWRIRHAIKKINNIHPELSKHLKASVKTGTYCSYSPEIEVDWEFYES